MEFVIVSDIKNGDKVLLFNVDNIPYIAIIWMIDHLGGNYNVHLCEQISDKSPFLIETYTSDDYIVRIDNDCRLINYAIINTNVKGCDIIINVQEYNWYTKTVIGPIITREMISDNCENVVYQIRNAQTVIGPDHHCILQLFRRDDDQKNELESFIFAIYTTTGLTMRDYDLAKLSAF